MDRDLRRTSLDALRDLNELQANELGHPETLTRIAQYELAFRMQTSRARGDGHLARSRRRRSTPTAPRRARRASPTTACSPAGWSSRACASCSSSTGAGTSTAPAPATTSATACRRSAATMDQPVAALINDLKQRGLLDDTLVVWGGEFGRTPFREGRTAGGNVLGRDHHPDCFSLVPGRRRRQGRASRTARSDELGFSVAEGQGPRPRPAGDDPAPARASTTRS